MTLEKTQKKSFRTMVSGLPANFWYANIMELFERLAFFGVRAISALYLVRSAEENGLGLSYPQKGWIYTVWALLQCLIPMVSGGYTERYGYRKSLAVAFTLNILGYLGMAFSLPLAQHFSSQGWEGGGFWVFMAAACLVATGTAIFKPPVQGTVAKATTSETSSMGWGLFYWVVNIGGALAPMAAAQLRGEIDWDHVFIGAAIVTAVNFLPAFLLYKEPERVPPEEGEEQPKGPLGVFVSSILSLFKDMRLVVFLLIFSCFWLMFMQLWDLLPNFIDEWVDTSDVASVYAWINPGWVQESGQTKPEMIININSISIIALVLLVSWIVGKFSKVGAMVAGMVISLVGFVGAGATAMGLFCCIMIFVFSIGEMTCSPTFSAYVGLIAPKDKKALYMGYSNIPFAIGWAAGGWLGNTLYDKMAAKYTLARQYLVDRLGMDAAAAFNEEAFPNSEVMQEMAARMETTAEGARQVLWDLHHPYMVFYCLGVIGLLGTVGMLIFYFATKKAMAAESAAMAAAEGSAEGAAAKEAGEAEESREEPGESLSSEDERLARRDELERRDRQGKLERRDRDDTR